MHARAHDLNIIHAREKYFQKILYFFRDWYYNSLEHGNHPEGEYQMKVTKVTLNKDIKMCGCAVFLRAGESYELIRKNSRYAYIKILNGITARINISDIK